MIQAKEALKEYNLNLDKFIRYQKSTINKMISLQFAPADKVNQFIKLETFGGACPVCKKSWKEIIVKNKIAEFVYYNPDCSCYAKCPECGTSWHREMGIFGLSVGEIKECSMCKWKANPQYIRMCGKCYKYFRTEDKAYYAVCSKCKSKEKKKEESI